MTATGGTATAVALPGGASRGGPDPFPAGRFLSEAECHALIQRVLGFAAGGGETQLYVQSRWVGNLRWARNSILSAGDTRSNEVHVKRVIRGAEGNTLTNVLDDRHLRWNVARAEQSLVGQAEVPAALRGEPEPVGEPLRPPLWFDATYHQDAAERAELMHALVQPAQAAGLLAAGYLEVAARGESLMNGARVWYYPYTTALYTVTVRTPDGSGSGWAGADHNDWTKIDAAKLSRIALEKCLRSRNPVRLEPGRYTAILEPQAVGDLVMPLFNPGALDRGANEGPDPTVLRTDPRYKPNPQRVFNDGPGYSKLGEPVIDARLTVRTDCTDPDLGFPPFGNGWVAYQPVTWIQDGVLTVLAYGREYAVQKLGRDAPGVYQYGANLGSRATGAFRMSVTGATTSVEEMIATTRRGLLVTRFVGVQGVPLDPNPALLLTGYTRDGLWLVENGKISKPVKNFRFTESPVFALNNIEQLGVPQRIYNQLWPPSYMPTGYPIVVPALKVRDFSFTALTDAV